MDALAFRFSDDNPALYGIACSQASGNERARANALSQHVRTSDAVLPTVHNSSKRALTSLGIANPLTTFVYPSPETNAYCFAGAADSSILVFVSSALVKLLTAGELAFVVGHELGHHLFGHGTYPSASAHNGSLRVLELHRAAELSADRAGLIACGDLDTAITAVLKVASGLDEHHLDIDVRDYVNQVKDLQRNVGDESLIFATHPSFPLRARALLRFDSVLRDFQGGSDVEISLRQTDDRIRMDAELATQGSAGNAFSDLAQTAAFWAAAHALCQQGRFGIAEQQILATKFGPDKVDALRRKLAGASRQEGTAFLAGKFESTQADLNTAPLFVGRAAAALTKDVMACSMRASQ